MTHAHLKSSILVALSARGVFCWNNPTGVATPLGSHTPVRYGIPGAPDILGILPGGRLIAVECKVGRDRVREEQARWHARARELGALVVVARTVEECLTAIDASPTLGG
jgi:hypothetical protein